MSTVQFNLLPDVKMTYVKAQRNRNMVFTVSILVTLGAIGLLLIMLFAVDVVQKRQLSGADNNVKKYSKQLQSIPNVNKILTVQNQLKTLTGLHGQKHISSRIFTYLPEITPTKVSISQVNLDFTANTFQITGNADSHQTVNIFIDTIKFTNYKVADSEAKPAFSGVVETNFSLDAKGASYTLGGSFDPILFSNALGGKIPELVVPKLTTTRSVLDDPANVLFNTPPPPPPTKQGSQ